MLITYWFLAINIVIYISANKVYVMLYVIYANLSTLLAAHETVVVQTHYDTWYNLTAL